MRIDTLKKTKTHRTAGRSRAGTAFIFMFLTTLGVFVLLPYGYSVLSSLKPLEEIYRYPPRFFVRRPTLDNFTMLFRLSSNLLVPFSRYVFNSITISAIVTAGHILIASMCAYSLSKFKLRISPFFNVVVVGLFFSTAILWLPQYILLARLHILNTPIAYILSETTKCIIDRGDLN